MKLRRVLQSLGLIVLIAAVYFVVSLLQVWNTGRSADRQPVGAIVLPTGAADKSVVSVNCTQIVTTLSVTSGNTVTGAPTTLAANGFFTMRYDAATAAWYRVG